LCGETEKGASGVKNVVATVLRDGAVGRPSGYHAAACCNQQVRRPLLQKKETAS
jgi:hypothetical protein